MYATFKNIKKAVEDIRMVVQKEGEDEDPTSSASKTLSSEQVHHMMGVKRFPSLSTD